MIIFASFGETQRINVLAQLTRTHLMHSMGLSMAKRCQGDFDSGAALRFSSGLQKIKLSPGSHGIPWFQAAIVSPQLAAQGPLPAAGKALINMWQLPSATDLDLVFLVGDQAAERCNRWIFTSWFVRTRYPHVSGSCCCCGSQAIQHGWLLTDDCEYHAGHQSR